MIEERCVLAKLFQKRKMYASEIPSDLWRKILEIGVKRSAISYKDLCCVSISCRRLHRLSNEDPLWSYLFSVDFDFPIGGSSSSPAKSLYRIRFEREKQIKAATHMRALLSKEREICERRRWISQVETQLTHETEMLRAVMVNLSNVQEDYHKKHKKRQALVALKRLLPEMVLGRQKKIVEQHPFCLETPIRSLVMEMKLCKQEIWHFNKILRFAKGNLDRAMKERDFLNYQLRESEGTASGDKKSKLMRKKPGTCISCEFLEFFKFSFSWR